MLTEKRELRNSFHKVPRPAVNRRTALPSVELRQGAVLLVAAGVSQNRVPNMDFLGEHRSRR